LPPAFHLLKLSPRRIKVSVCIALAPEWARGLAELLSVEFIETRPVVWIGIFR
jgi:hypothetical protein